jgi:hypothetical protein
MPFKSQAQRRKFAQLMVEGKISPQTFEEWSRETGSAKLPERVRGSSARKSAKKAAGKPAKKRSGKVAKKSPRKSVKKAGGSAVRTSARKTAKKSRAKARKKTA